MGLEWEFPVSLMALGTTEIQMKRVTGTISAIHPFLFSVIMGNYFIGTETSSLELGAGVVIGEFMIRRTGTDPLPNAATFTIGYRYMNRKKWYPTVKAGVTPMIGFNGRAHMRVGISIGVMISGAE